MSEDVVFNLAKDEVFDLTKLSAGIKDIYVGLKWDPAVAGKDVDLDAILIATDSSGVVISGMHSDSFLFYHNNGRAGTSPVAFEITEDNLDGEDVDNGFADDESIFVYSDKIDPKITQLHIYVVFTDAAGRTLKDVSNVTVTIAPFVDGKPVLEDGSAVYSVSDIGASEGAYMAVIQRNEISGWDVKAVGEQSGNLRQVASIHGLGTSNG